ncbi:MAG TPA: SDR family NAD(P)-dependent oxidoreductase [Propionibacteriaceae bacterium]|nr:SDR family NAD(P)-dependent oxidoreductase [Propionibacteriaceae bacterium]
MTSGQGLVVGATSEIGTAIATSLVSEVNRLVLWGRDPDRLAGAAAACRAARPELEVETRAVDVTRSAELADGVAALCAGGPVKVVVWTPGLFDWAPAQEADSARWRELAEVNVTAPMEFTPLVLPALVDAAPSALIYLGSGGGHAIYPNNAAYVSSKHAIAALAHATYADVRRYRVKVCVIAPGLVAAGPALWSPVGQEHPERLLRPEDVAAAVRFVVGFGDHGCPTEIRLQPHLME